MKTPQGSQKERVAKKSSILVLLFAATIVILIATGCSPSQSTPSIPTGSPTSTTQATQRPLMTPTLVSAFPSDSTAVPQSTAQTSRPITTTFTTGETREALETRLFSSGYKQETRCRQPGSRLVHCEGIPPVTINTVTYHTVLYYHSLAPQRLLIYRADGEQQTLLYDLESDVKRIPLNSRYRSDLSYYVVSLALASYEIEGNEIVGWYDMNGDGLLELAVFISDESNSWSFSQIQVLQLHPDEGVVNLTLSVPPEDELELGTFAVHGLEDIDGDGVIEWVVGDVRFECAVSRLGHACSPSSTRIYAWDGSVYRNASTRFPEYYQPIIDDYQARVSRVSNADEWYGENLHDLLSLLMTLENVGKLEEGQAIVKSYGTDYFDDSEDGGLVHVWRHFAEVFGVAPR